jgi:hypothetical protein
MPHAGERIGALRAMLVGVNERDASSGGMTGATGDLTPSGDPAEFAPGELREVSSPEHQGDVTRSQARHSSEHADQPFDEGRESQLGGDERGELEERL